MNGFDLAVIGGGTAGLTGAQVAASLGARVALIEKDRFGGECLHTGCVPSKTLLGVANEVHGARRAGRYGLLVEGEVDWDAVRARLREVIARIEPNDGPDALRRAGVTPIVGTARFVSPHELEVEGHGRVRAKTFLIATGGRAKIPDLPGLRELPYLTNDTVFDLPGRPRHLVILGGGPVGCEFAQAFARLGSRVTLLEAESQLLGGEEPEIADFLLGVLREEEIEVRLSARVESAAELAGLGGSHVLIAAGRSPNVRGLGLEDIGVIFDEERGVHVDAVGRTNLPHVFAAGDVTGAPFFTHAAFEEGLLAALGARGPAGRLVAAWRARVKRPGALPAVTFTDPEVARFGLTERQARQRFGERGVTVVDYDLSKLDRAVTDGARGRVKLVFKKNLPAPSLVGAGVAGPRAGELLQLFMLAHSPLRLALTPAAYPTYAEGPRWAAAGLFAEGHLFGRKR